MSFGDMLAFVLIAAFAIDRICTAVQWLLSSTPWFPDPASKEAANVKGAALRYKGAYYVPALLLAILVLWKWQALPIVEALEHIDPSKRTWLDYLLTLLLLVGGADRISSVLSSIGGEEKEVSSPVTITGTITLADKPSPPK